MSTTATSSTALSWRQKTASIDIQSDKRNKIDQAPTWRRSSSPDLETSRRLTVTGERTEEERLSARQARSEKQKSKCRECQGLGRCNESDRIKLYCESKQHTNRFIDWLVEAVYPNGIDTPSWIEHRGDSPNHGKYHVTVTMLTNLAAAFANSNPQPRTPWAMVSQLTNAIDERSQYSHQMQHIAEDSAQSRRENEKHQYMIDALEDVKTILGSRRKPQLATTTSITSIDNPTTGVLQRSLSTLGKRKPVLTDHDDDQQRKAAKPAAAAPTTTTMTATTSTTQQRPRVALRSCKLVTSAKAMSWVAVASASIKV